MNQKGEFPKEARVSARVHESTKRLLKRLKEQNHSEAEVIEYAAKQLSSEPLLLEWEIGELELKEHKLEAELHAVKAEKQAKLNRLNIIAPKMLDDDTKHNMLVESAKNYAKELVGKREGFIPEMLDAPLAKSSVGRTGEEWGFDPSEFLDEVRNQIKILCHTGVCDN